MNLFSPCHPIHCSEIGFINIAESKEAKKVVPGCVCQIPAKDTFLLTLLIVRMTLSPGFCLHTQTKDKGFVDTALPDP